MRYENVINSLFEYVNQIPFDIDFLPISYYSINVEINFIAVPPHQILVYDASGRDVAGAVGPLQEGDNLVLTCEVRGGKCLIGNRNEEAWVKKTI